MYMHSTAAMTSLLRRPSLNRHEVMAAYCPPTLAYNDAPSGIDCHSSIPYYDDLYTEPLKRQTFSRKSSAQRLRDAVHVGLRACRSKLGSSSRPSTPRKCDNDSDGLSIMCAGLDESRVPEVDRDRRRSSGSHYSTSSSSFGPLYSSFSPSSPSTSSQSACIRSRSASDSSQDSPAPASPIAHQFAFPLVSLTQAAGETVITKRPELYERASMDSIASCVTKQWRSRIGYCAEWSAGLSSSSSSEEWQYDNILSLYEPVTPPVCDEPYDMSEELLPPLPPAVVSTLAARSTPKPPRKRNVLRRCPRARIDGRSLRQEFIELDERVTA